MKRIISNAQVAILFIHGILGTPYHFHEFLSLIPDDISVYNLLLDGHGKGAKDFSRTSMKKWEAQAQEAVEELSLTHETIYIVAHSMGTLLSIEQAVKNPKIKRLFFLSIPTKISLKTKVLTNSLKIYFNKINPNDKMTIATKNCFGIHPDKNPFHYIGWIPRFLELFSKIRCTKAL